jgi:hypothetical protein
MTKLECPAHAVPRRDSGTAHPCLLRTAPRAAVLGALAHGSTARRYSDTPTHSDILDPQATCDLHCVLERGAQIFPRDLPASIRVVAAYRQWQLVTGGVWTPAMAEGHVSWEYMGRERPRLRHGAGTSSGGVSARVSAMLHLPNVTREYLP